MMQPSHPLSIAFLQTTAQAIRQPFPGYPTPEDRLFIDSAGLVIQPGKIIIPDGPWHIRNHANRTGMPPNLMDPELVNGALYLPPERVQSWQSQGLHLDQHNRPLHPHYRQLLQDRHIGLPTGLGAFFRYGANTIADAILYRRSALGGIEFLCVKQRRNGKWGLPGGFAESQDESLEATARRELHEETGVLLHSYTTQLLIHQLPVRQRDTLHAWAEVAVFLFDSSNPSLQHVTPQPGDDAIDAAWVHQKEIQALDMLDTHPPYIAKALAFLAQQGIA